MEIWSHAEDMRKDTSAWSKFESIFARLTEFYGEKALVDKETLFQLHCRDFINRHAISDRSYLKEIGKGKQSIRFKNPPAIFILQKFQLFTVNIFLKNRTILGPLRLRPQLPTKCYFHMQWICGHVERTQLRRRSQR